MRAEVCDVPALSFPLIGFTCGVSFAWAAAEELSQRQGALHSSSAWIVALYALLVHSPAVAYLFAVYPDWSTGYMLAPEDFSPAVVPSLLFVNLVLPIVGFLWASEAASQHSALKVVRLGGTSLALVCVVTLVFIPRLVVAANYNEYHHNFGIRSIAGSALGYSLLYLVILTSAAATWTYTALKRLGRKTSFATRRTGWIR